MRKSRSRGIGGCNESGGLLEAGEEGVFCWLITKPGYSVSMCTTFTTLRKTYSRVTSAWNCDSRVMLSYSFKS